MELPYEKLKRYRQVEGTSLILVLVMVLMTGIFFYQVGMSFFQQLYRYAYSGSSGASGWRMILSVLLGWGSCAVSVAGIVGFAMHKRLGFYGFVGVLIVVALDRALAVVEYLRLGVPHFGLLAAFTMLLYLAALGYCLWYWQKSPRAPIYFMPGEEYDGLLAQAQKETQN